MRQRRGRDYCSARTKRGSPERSHYSLSAALCTVQCGGARLSSRARKLGCEGGCDPTGDDGTEAVRVCAGESGSELRFPTEAGRPFPGEAGTSPLRLPREPFPRPPLAASRCNAPCGAPAACASAGWKRCMRIILAPGPEKALPAPPPRAPPRPLRASLAPPLLPRDTSAFIAHCPKANAARSSSDMATSQPPLDSTPAEAARRPSAGGARAP
eukprot:scaffold87493_cov25-Tisochrysis_lutea.AAC.6